MGFESESELESELLYDWRFTANYFVLATSPLRPTTIIFIFQLTNCGYSPSVTSSLMRGWVCRLQLLLVLASAFILRSESGGAHYHILWSQIRDSCNAQGQVPVFISSRNWWPCYSSWHWVPFSSPPMKSRATVEVFDRAPTRAVVMKRSIFWDIRQSSACHLLSYLASSTLKMEVKCSSETSVGFQRTTRRYILEDRTLYKNSP
jgi:hypothetical protein